ncbi:translation initiation factor IF-2 [Rhodotorula diobovata]|uniref:Translation initiation factor IF-2 n=1 Tax=Rhodotorula diobovata TaxID=5288 RepID=A0A5C5G223_9BASI|nr:translation initiation factor IF-2 [Rhodotorula diobovata]
MYAAGSNSHGQLGPSHRDDLARWTRIPLPESDFSVNDVACGANHSLVVATDSHGRARLFGAGSDARGQLSSRPDSRLRIEFEPLEVEQLCDGLQLPLAVDEYSVERIAAAWETSFVVLRPRDPTSDASDVLLSLGANDWGERGSAHATKDGASLVALGEGISGSEGTRTAIRVVDLVAGPRHALALVEVRHVVEPSTNATRTCRRVGLGWGASRHGQLGPPPLSSVSPRITPTPQEVLLPASYTGANIVDVSVGRDHSALLLRREGHDRVLLLGSNKHGQLGPLPPASPSTAPTPIRKSFLAPTDLQLSPALPPSARVSAVHCTWSSTFFAVSSTHPVTPSLVAFGLNAHGQLGARSPPSPALPATTPASSPCAVPAFPPASTLRALAAGSEHVLALLERDDDAEVWGWGWNEHGNLGLAPGEGDGARGGGGEAEAPADVRVPRRVWPPIGSAEDGGDADETRKGGAGRPVRVWAGMASSWILVEEDDSGP